MKKLLFLVFLPGILLCTSCQFNQSAHKDLSTGAYSRGNGIGCDNVRIEISGTSETRNEFVYGEKVDFVFNDIRGLQNIDGKFYPGMSMHVVKNEKDTILSKPNLLENLKQGTDLSPLQLRAHFRALLPYENEEDYKVFVKIWDQKGEGTFTYELPFTVAGNNLLKIQNDGIEYSNIYLWNESSEQPVYHPNVNFKDLYILILEGIEGLSEENGKVYPIFSIELMDNHYHHLQFCHL